MAIRWGLLNVITEAMNLYIARTGKTTKWERFVSPFEINLIFSCLEILKHKLDGPL